jgi:2-dehydro-3-deoxygluconokinase
MKFKHALYDIVVPTSMGIRITPEAREPVHTSNLYKMQVTSAESHVITPSASLGLKTKVLTAFVKDSPIARFIKSDLGSRFIEFEGPEIAQGGPWGFRHQINIADSGFGLRAPRVQNDRAGEVGRELSVDDFDLDKLFVDEGIKLIHISGLIAALSPKSGKFCLDLAKKAEATGTKVSFDLNFRASFWNNRETELREIFTEIAKRSNILIGNEEDFQLALVIKGPEAGGDELAVKIENFKTMIDSIEKTFPKTELVATTLREVVSANEHLWGAILKAENKWFVEEPRPIPVHDRIGGGDGFVGGLLYGLVSSMLYEKAFQFGWANGALTATLQNDYSQPMNEEQVFSVYEGNARVRR